MSGEGDKNVTETVSGSNADKIKESNDDKAIDSSTTASVGSATSTSQSNIPAAVSSKQPRAYLDPLRRRVITNPVAKVPDSGKYSWTKDGFARNIFTCVLNLLIISMLIK